MNDFSKIGFSLPKENRDKETLQQVGRIQVLLTETEYSWIKAMRAAKTCQQKRTYKTEKDANTACRHRMNETGALLKIYQCPVCNFWHLTSTGI